MKAVALISINLSSAETRYKENSEQKEKGCSDAEETMRRAIRRRKDVERLMPGALTNARQHNAFRANAEMA
jgi:hypothetical protein